MSHIFTVYRNNQLITVSDYHLIPDEFDFLIEFKPEIPPEPHTEAEHREIESWNEKFFSVLKREKSCQQWPE